MSGHHILNSMQLCVISSMVTYVGIYQSESFFYIDCSFLSHKMWFENTIYQNGQFKSKIPRHNEIVENLLERSAKILKSV